MKTRSKLNRKTSFQRRLTFVLDMISVLPTDLFFFYTGVACHEQVDLWYFLFSSSKRDLKDFVIKSAHRSRFKILILILRFPVLWSWGWTEFSESTECSRSSRERRRERRSQTLSGCQRSSSTSWLSTTGTQASFLPPASTSALSRTDGFMGCVLKF